MAGRDGPDQMHVVCARGPSRDVYTWVCDSRIPPHTMYPFKFNLNLNLNLNLKLELELPLRNKYSVEVDDVTDL